MTRSDNQQHFLNPYQLREYVPNTSLPAIQAAEKRSLPAFLTKLYRMVDAPETDPWVQWNDQGTSFIIPNSQTLAEKVLGHHFNHNKFTSFVRQLNMYGFHKVPHLNHGVLLNDGQPEVWEFASEYFRRDQPELMRHIIRKKGEAERTRAAARHQSSPTPCSPMPSSNVRFTDTNDMAFIHAEVRAIALRQNVIKHELTQLSKSTQQLWSYALDTRNRYDDQQEKLDTMIKFLSELFSKRSLSTNTELHNKVRGLLEGPVVEELPTPVDHIALDADALRYGPVELRRLFPNGKMPVEVAQQLYTALNAGNHHPTPPMCQASPETITTPDPTLFQTSQNYEHLAQMQNSANQIDHSVINMGNGLGIDLAVAPLDYTNFPTPCYPNDPTTPTLHLDVPSDPMQLEENSQAWMNYIHSDPMASLDGDRMAFHRPG